MTDGDVGHGAFLAQGFTASDEDAYSEALNEAMNLVEVAIKLVAVEAGRVIELDRKQPGGLSMTPSASSVEHGA